MKHLSMVMDRFDLIDYLKEMVSLVGDCESGEVLSLCDGISEVHIVVVDCDRDD
uniref:Uncharacterized protein n=1 Tax=Dulem virus 185 TaxID=3145662 RepID=A0AAU8AV00_9VIRU